MKEALGHERNFTGKWGRIGMSGVCWDIEVVRWDMGGMHWEKGVHEGLECT